MFWIGLVLAFIGGSVIGSTGYGVNTWRYWVILVSLMTSGVIAGLAQ